MSILSKAISDAERSYLSAKASPTRVMNSLVTRGPSMGLIHRPDLSHAQSQYDHNRSWVYAALRIIGSRIAGQRIHVGLMDSRLHRTRFGKLTKHALDPEITELQRHPLLDLLHNPSDLHTLWSLLFTTVSSILLTGRSLWWLPKQERCYPLPTHWLIGYDGTDKIQSWRVRPPGHAGDPFILPAAETCLFMLPDPSDPHRALSPLQATAHGALIDEQILQGQLQSFKNGIFSPMMLRVGRDPHPEVPGGLRPRLTGAQQRQVIQAIRKRYAGTVNSGEPLILDGLIEDAQRLSASNLEMDFVNSGRAVKERILQAFGVNEIALGQVEGANRSSSLMSDKHLAQYTLNPLITMMNAALSEWLSPQFSTDGQRLVVWIDEVVPSDAEMNFKWAQMMSQFGAISVNELRRLSPFDLPEDSMYEGLVPVGQQQQGLAGALRSEMQGILAEGFADEILEMSRIPEPSKNGKH